MQDRRNGRIPEIFIVENEAIIALELKFNLQNLGYAVSRSATSGHDAIRLVKEKAPDIVVMDILLQGDLDGIETAKRIKESLDVPIVYLTASSDLPTVRRSLKTNPAGYLHKPYNETNLRYTLEFALNKHRAEQELLRKEVELERARKELQQKSELLQGLLDHSPALIQSKNVEGKYNFINKRYAELFGLTYEDILGKSSAEVFPEDLAEYMIAHDKAVLERGSPVTRDYAHRAAPNRRWRSVKFPLFDERGTIIAVCGISTELQPDK